MRIYLASLTGLKKKTEKNLLNKINLFREVNTFRDKQINQLFQNPLDKKISIDRNLENMFTQITSKKNFPSPSIIPISLLSSNKINKNPGRLSSNSKFSN